MSKIYLADHETRHFLSDSNGDLYAVSKEIADKYAAIHPRETAVIERVDPETNTIWFTSPLPKEVKADA